MRLRTVIAVAAGAAYLFGTENGRQLVEQVKAKVKGAWADPKVQESVRDFGSKAADLAHETADNVVDVVEEAARKAKDAVSRVEELVDEAVERAAGEANPNA